MYYNLRVNSVLLKRIRRYQRNVQISEKNLLVFCFLNGYAEFIGNKQTISDLNKLVKRFNKEYDISSDNFKVISISISPYIDTRIKELKAQSKIPQQIIFLSIAITEFSEIEKNLKNLKDHSLLKEKFSYQKEMSILLKCFGISRKDFQRMAETILLNKVLCDLSFDITHSPEYFSLES